MIPQLWRKNLEDWVEVYLAVPREWFVLPCYGDTVVMATPVLTATLGTGQSEIGLAWKPLPEILKLTYRLLTTKTVFSWARMTSTSMSENLNKSTPYATAHVREYETFKFKEHVCSTWSIKICLIQELQFHAAEMHSAVTTRGEVLWGGPTLESHGHAAA